MDIPSGVTNGVSKDIYDQYRAGRDSACIDLVIAGVFRGNPVVLLSKRSKTVCYGEKWWMYGGALAAYASIEEFITERVKKESGVDIKDGLKALVGVYRTGSSDQAGSTLQVCYAAFVQEDVLESFSVDSAHDQAKLFTKEDLDQIPSSEKHWYPMRVATAVLSAI